MLVVEKIGAAAIKGWRFFAAARTHFLHAVPNQAPAAPSMKDRNSARGPKQAATSVKNLRVAQNDPPGRIKVNPPTKPGKAPRHHARTTEKAKRKVPPRKGFARKIEGNWENTRTSKNELFFWFSTASLSSSPESGFLGVFPGRVSPIGFSVIFRIP